MTNAAVNSVKIGIVQLCSSSKWQENLVQIEEYIKTAKSKGAELVLLPESALQMESFAGQKYELTREDIAKFIYSSLSEFAKNNNIYLVTGTLPVASKDKKKPFARCYVFNNQGQEVCHYDKIHLFDVELEEGESYRESDTTSAGSKLRTFSYKGVKFALSVCYDLRFPEMYRLYQQQEAEVILVPSAFTYKTGLVHWELLLKARAVENQCFVLAANQTGIHDNGRRTYGYSMAIGPWGDILASLEEQSELLVVELDMSRIKALNNSFPVHKHRVFISNE